MPIAGLALVGVLLIVLPGSNLPGSHLLSSSVLGSGTDASPTSEAPAARRASAKEATPISRKLARTGPERLKTTRARTHDNPEARQAVTILAVRAERELRRQELELRRQKLERKAQRVAEAQKTSSFRVGSFNILGSQHTRGPGGYGPGPERAAISSGLITARGVDVVGLQEVQDDQLPVFLSRLAGYSVWPQHALGSNGQRLQIAWRDSRFEMVDAGSITYVFDSQSIPLPYVLLRDRESLAEFWVMTTHNSARDLEGQRDDATAREISLIRTLMESTGKPVIITGDVNEHEEFFYKVCQSTGFLAANGGGAGCTLPPRPLRVDWIMGGGGAGVSFSGYVQDGASLARASDHYFIHANVSVVDPGGQG